jgi:carboxylesterase
MTSPLIPGAEPLSHVGSKTAGALVIHGFTGNPGSMRGVAEAFVAAGYHVEMPLLSGHGTSVEDMLPTRWADWAADAEAAYQRLAERADKVVVVGLSMGGALTLRVGADHPEVVGLVCINPLTNSRGDDAAAMSAMLLDMANSGTESFPAIGSDIADPDATESAYDATPIRPLVSLLQDGVGVLADEYPSMTMPLLLMNSPQDHVVQPEQAEFLAAEYGGPVSRVTLERSYHVATQDFDKELIFAEAVAFADRLTA